MVVDNTWENIAGPRYERFVDVKGTFGNNSILDIALPDIQHLIHPYWYAHHPVEPIWLNLVALFMCVAGVLSFIGNGLVVFIFTTTEGLRTPSNYLIVNLSFSEFCMMNIMCPTIMSSCFKGTWPYGPLGCQLYAFHGTIFGISAISTMTLISLDRYHVIVKGVGGKPMSVKAAIVKIICVWLYGIIWALPPLFGWNKYIPEGSVTSCGTDYFTQDMYNKSYIIVMSIFCYFIPLFTIIWAYYYIVKTVFDHEANMREQAKKMNVASLRSGDANTNIRAEVQLAKVAMMTVSLWFVAWTPYLITNYVGIFEMCTITPFATVLASVFAKANAVYNPIVYAVSHPKFQAALKEKMPLIGACLPDASKKAKSTATKETAAE